MERTGITSHRGNTRELVIKEFQARYGQSARLFRAPGRVNLIGEHTDYNDGFVMPAALGFYTYVAAGIRQDDKLCVDSLDFQQPCQFEMSDMVPGPTGHWSDYVRGVAAVLRSCNFPVRGANLLVKSDVPIGAGLSSSAAIEVATALALLAVFDIHLDLRRVASICQGAEHEFAGTKCGIMDQFVSCFGQASHALLLDCRSLHFETLPIDERVPIVLCNTMVKHELAGGEYNRRRADCEAGVNFLRQFIPGIRALRDVTLQQLADYGRGMPSVTSRRCRHVISENLRVLEAAEALRRDDLRRFGTLMTQSHASLRNDYQVSCKELDLMVQLASRHHGVFGARMTGGGFGGCTVNLVEASAVSEFTAGMSRDYENATGLRPDIYVCTPGDGAAEVTQARA
jgi:galactokinase